MPGLLTLAITLPILGAVLLLFIANKDGSKDGLIRYIALGVSLATFAVTLALWAGFDQSGGAAPFQFIERVPWIPAFGIEYYVGLVDERQHARLHNSRRCRLVCQHLWRRSTC